MMSCSPTLIAFRRKYGWHFKGNNTGLSLPALRAVTLSMLRIERGDSPDIADFTLSIACDGEGGRAKQ